MELLLSNIIELNLGEPWPYGSALIFISTFFLFRRADFDLAESRLFASQVFKPFRLALIAALKTPADIFFRFEK